MRLMPLHLQTSSAKAFGDDLHLKQCPQLTYPEVNNMKALTLTVEAKTSLREQYGLFDYDSYYYNRQSLNIKTNTTLTLSRQKVRPIEELTQTESADCMPLLTLGKTLSKSNEPVFSVTSEVGHRVWLIVSCLPKENGVKGYKLMRGDTLRIGRSKLKVKEMQEPSKVKLEGESAISKAKVPWRYSE
jgi:hypothetical protein